MQIGWEVRETKEIVRTYYPPAYSSFCCITRNRALHRQWYMSCGLCKCGFLRRQNDSCEAVAGDILMMSPNTRR